MLHGKPCNHSRQPSMLDAKGGKIKFLSPEKNSHNFCVLNELHSKDANSVLKVIVSRNFQQLTSKAEILEEISPKM